ncbi:GAF domain-containing protein [Persicobacter diffluens]|uniref:GAF domain-containing protein n=1 Tax=Persicobacter diffluens TaxID=981 RepID=A0AAN5ALS6_9BACT|nr:hypothetical protein PEDI_22730 [Persicobacter diffluens]
MFKSIFENGLKACPEHLQDYIKSQNIIVIIGIFTSIGFTIFNYIEMGDAYFPTLFACICFCSAFVLTKNQQYLISRIIAFSGLFIPTFILAIYFRTDMGIRSWMMGYILAAAISSSIYFSFKEKSITATLWILTLIGLLASPYSDAFGIKKLELDILNNTSFIQLNIATSLGFLLVAIRLSEGMKNKTHLKNLELFSSMESKTEELEKQRLHLENQQKENELYRLEEQKRQWQTEGINIFSSLLREGNLEDIKDQFMKQMVEYLKLNQAAIFIAQTQDDKTILNMEACYAYGRNKNITAVVAPGEGLLGQCFLEKDEIYLLEIPEGYTKITSGLGEATPKCLCLAPLKVGDKVLGVVETASFKALEDHQRAFFLNLCEILASAIEQSKSTAETKKLLQASQKQAQKLSAQEEEMRQNIEELSSTQEQFERERKMLLEKIEELQKQKPLVESH